MARRDAVHLRRRGDHPFRQPTVRAPRLVVGFLESQPHFHHALGRHCGPDRPGRRHPRLRPPAFHHRLRRTRLLPDQVQRLDVHHALRVQSRRRRLPPMGPGLLVAKHPPALRRPLHLRRLRPDAVALPHVFRRRPPRRPLPRRPLLHGSEVRRHLLHVRGHLPLGRRVYHVLWLDHHRRQPLHRRWQVAIRRLAQARVGRRPRADGHGPRLLRSQRRHRFSHRQDHPRRAAHHPLVR